MVLCVYRHIDTSIVDLSIVVNRLVDCDIIQNLGVEIVFYDIFIKLCEDSCTTPATVRKDLGISQSTMASWKSRGLTPKPETIQKLADYFGVSWTELVPDSTQSAAITSDYKNKVGTTVVSDGYIVHQGVDQSCEKISFAEAYKAGLFNFYSEGDRIVFFYNQLTKEDRLSVGTRIFRHLDLDKDVTSKDILSKIADYIMNLLENPKYQRTHAPQPTSPARESKETIPATDAPKTPPEGK